MFIQYHDIIKPVYLYAIVKMMLTNDTHGLPFNIINQSSILSLVEWYIRRREINPLCALDFNHIGDHSMLDDILYNELISDPSIYRIASPLLIQQLFIPYQAHHMTFPVFVYSEREEPAIAEDAQRTIHGPVIKYLYGDLRSAIQKCDQNFTYIFSDLELLKKAAEILHGTYSHLLLASDYRYNYIGGYKRMKYNLQEIAKSHPFIRIGLTTACDWNQLAIGLGSIYGRE